MAVGAFPAVKLGILAFKQLSKPIANHLKERAKTSPFFREKICMPPAQFYHWAEVKTKMWVLNLGQPIKVPPLTETMAIELGANLLGECVIFSIGAAALVFEYLRQAKKDAKKEELIEQEKKELIHTLNDFALQLERQETQMREMSRVIADLESRNWLPRIPKLMPDKKQKEPENPPPTAPGAAGTANAASATSNKSQARPAPTKNQSTVSATQESTKNSTVSSRTL